MNEPTTTYVSRRGTDGWYLYITSELLGTVNVGPYRTKWGAQRVGRRAAKERAAFAATPTGKLGAALDTYQLAKRKGQDDRLPRLRAAVESAAATWRASTPSA